MSTTTARATHPSSGQTYTIGAVCDLLRDEFSDISISKIRYLEDQGLLHPRRTRGGYRLFSEEDIERLTTILRLQRDEFLPLRVIREELDAPSAERAHELVLSYASQFGKYTLESTYEYIETAGLQWGELKGYVELPQINQGSLEVGYYRDDWNPDEPTEKRKEGQARRHETCPECGGEVIRQYSSCEKVF